MGPTAAQVTPGVEDSFRRGLSAQSAGNGGLTPATPVVANDQADRFGEALNAATLAIANLTLALHRAPLYKDVRELHPGLASGCQVAAIIAALSQDGLAVKESTDDTGDELFGLITAVLDGEHEDAALIHDVERRREVCRAWARSLITTYRQALGGQLAVLRSGVSQ